MKLWLVVAGTKVPDWVQTGFAEYLRRFPKDMPFELIEIPTGRCGESANIRRILDKEGEQMLATAGKNRIVTLDAPDRPWDTPQLAVELGCRRLDGRDVSLLVGGSGGLPSTCKAATKQGWSLLTLTFPHPLVHVLVVKSLHRAWSITISRPYHRE